MNRSFAVLFPLFFLLHSSCFYSRIWEALCLLVPAEIRPILFYTKQMGSVCGQLLSQHIYKYQQSSAWMWISRSCSSDPNPELRNHEGAQQKLKSLFSSEHDRYRWTPGFSREVDARLGQLKVGCTARHSFSILRLSNQISQHNRTLPTFAVHSHTFSVEEVAKLKITKVYESHWNEKKMKLFVKPTLKYIIHLYFSTGFSNRGILVILAQ